MNKGFKKVADVLQACCAARGAEARVKYTASPKKCIFCRAEISYEARHKKKFCNQSCAAKFNNVGRRVEKICVSCGSLHRKKTNWCSRECSRKKYIADWLAGTETGGYGKHDDCVSNAVRKYLFSIRGEKCEECGWARRHPLTHKIPLTLHHKDGNPCNHSIDNLQILCPCCHSLTDTYGSLNKGRGRGVRRK